MMVEVLELELLRKAGLVKLGHGFLEETKVKLNASKNKATSYGGMKEKRRDLRKRPRG